MNLLLLILIVGLPFSSLVIHINDIWHSQGAYFQLILLCSFSYSIYRPSRKPLHNTLKLENRPLALLTFWLGLMTLVWWYLHLVRFQQYNFLIFMPFFNFLCFVLFYQLITLHLTKKDIEKTLLWLSYTIGIIAVYCFLQVLDLDQFHKPFWLRPENLTNTAIDLTDELVGTIGNSTHLSGWLSICLPVLYYVKTKFSTISILLVWVIILMTASASGLVGAILITIFYNAFHQIRFKHERFIFSLLGVFFILTIYLKGFGWLSNFVNTSGRFEFWKELYPIFHGNPITGSGLGRIMALGQYWKHVHNEFYQVAIEGGLIGLGIVIYGIIHYFMAFWEQRKNTLALCVATMFLAFLINCFFNFTAHLWQTACLGMLAYGSLYVIKSEEI